MKLVGYVDTIQQFDVLKFKFNAPPNKHRMRSNKIVVPSRRLTVGRHSSQLLIKVADRTLELKSENLIVISIGDLQDVYVG